MSDEVWIGVGVGLAAGLALGVPLGNSWAPLARSWRKVRRHMAAARYHAGQLAGSGLLAVAAVAAVVYLIVTGGRP